MLQLCKIVFFLVFVFSMLKTSAASDAKPPKDLSTMLVISAVIKAPGAHEGSLGRHFQDSDLGYPF